MHIPTHLVNEASKQAIKKPIFCVTIRRTVCISYIMGNSSENEMNYEDEQ